MYYSLLTYTLYYICNGISYYTTLYCTIWYSIISCSMITGLPIMY